MPRATEELKGSACYADAEENRQMRTDPTRELENYEKLRADKKRRDPFTADTIVRIYDLARTPRGLDTCKAIGDALAIGYSIGYRTAKRDAK